MVPELDNTPVTGPELDTDTTDQLSTCIECQAGQGIQAVEEGGY